MQPDGRSEPMSRPSRRVAATRTAVALVQGLALFLLHRSEQSKGWPSTDGLAFAPMMATAIFVPTIAAAGASHLRARTLALWLAAATALCAGLAIYGVYSDPTDDLYTAARARILPAPALWLSLAAMAFIAHALVAAGDAERRWIASYPSYHDAAWKSGLQLGLAVLFTGVFWALLWLGAELFRLVRIEFFTATIRRDWFAIPATVLVFAGAIHLTDVRTAIVRGTQTLALNLLSWLLPLMALIAAGFLIALIFTGLEPLWNTRRATAILLIAAAVLIFLVNATYQDGRSETARVLVYARLIAVVVLAPLVVLAAVGLALRIEQYGWSPSRIYALACVAVAACYALGYVLAALRHGPSLCGLERTNVGTAFVILAVLLALSTPIADPARISVIDQVRRLEEGRISPEQFDFAFLRFKTGRYGEQALERLKRKEDGPNAARIAVKANEALDWKTMSAAQRRVGRMTTDERAANITVLHPAGEAVPDGFLRQGWSAQQHWTLPSCLIAFDAKCAAILTDLDDDGTAEILLFSTPGGPAAAFKSGPENSWALLGTIVNAICPGVLDALKAGRFASVPSTYKDIEANGQRLYVRTGCTPARP